MTRLLLVAGFFLFYSSDLHTLIDENTEVETTPVDGPKTAQTLALGLITISGITLSLVILSPFSAVIA